MSKRKVSKHPTQDLVTDEAGTVRFRENKLVRHLLDAATTAGVCDLNMLARLPNIDVQDRQQLAQLIGYSLGGYSELPYVDGRAWQKLALKKVRPQL